ncbi:MAG: hypothetical protein ACPGAN_06570 [Candidatus Poseidoniaceae archaeon]
MGGLLDKANATSQEETTVEPVKTSETKAGQNKSDASKIVADVVPSKTAPAPISEGPDYLMIGTGVLLLVGLILSLQGGLVPKVVTLAILLGSVATTFFSGQMKDNIEPLKVIGVAILAILFFVAPMAVGLFVGDGTSVGIGEIELREDSNTIAFKARGSFGTAYASIVVDNGTGSEDVLWEEEKKMTSDSASFVVAIDDIFVGNAWDNNGQEQRVYNIVVTDGRDSESKVPINARYLTRQVTDTGFKLTPIFETTTNGDTTETTFEGFSMQVLFGILPDSHEHLDGASHTDTQGFIPVFGDYSIDVEVSKGSESWNHPKMTISGDTVGWTGKSSGPASPDGWIALSGNANDQYHGQYLAADGPGFEYSDGCWTFTVTVTHTTHVGESVLIDDDVSWDLDFEDRGTSYAAEVC